MTTRRVLIVDDNADVRYLTRLTIESDSCEVVGEAANGAEAISVAEELQPDAVVLDLRMPLMDGIEATKILRYRFPDLRIIVMSGSDDPLMVREISAAGADAAVDKDKLEDLVVHLDH
ncbi:MAG: response regulator transcription factor [Actinobacteria bacterium]|nr:response regulator transcription factor [Actinomycetota bacterium]